MEKNIILVGALLLTIAVSSCSTKNKKTSSNSVPVESSTEQASSNAVEQNSSNTTSSVQSNSSLVSEEPGVITNDLFISEFYNITYKLGVYVEENSNDNKAIELYNPTDAEIDLSKYHIECYSNGLSAIKNDNYAFTLEGTLKPYTCYTIVNNYANSNLKKYADKLDNVYIGPKSSVALFKGDNIIDVFGTIGASYNSNDDFVINGVVAATETRNVVRNVGYTANTKFTETEWESRTDYDMSSLGVHDKDTVQIELSDAKYAEEAKAALEIIAESLNDDYCGAQVEIIKEYEGFKFVYDFETLTGGKFNNEGTLQDPDLEDGWYVNFSISVLAKDGVTIIDTAYCCLMYVKA